LMLVFVVVSEACPLLCMLVSFVLHFFQSSVPPSQWRLAELPIAAARGGVLVDKQIKHDVCSAGCRPSFPIKLEHVLGERVLARRPR